MNRCVVLRFDLRGVGLYYIIIWEIYMLCKNCKKLIPDNSLSCPNCNKFPYDKTGISLSIDNNYLPARRWKRFINYSLDLLFYYLFIFIFAFIFALFSLKIFTDNPVLDFIISLGYYILYYAITEYFLSRSLAKFITRTYVFDYNGKKPEFKNIIIRTLSRFIPFEAFSLLSRRPIGWHDYLSKTIVVEKVK
jgi:uncharacterized RDD family membrane protein YckC